VFNMLPAFPMDGGRVLRALLAMRMGFVRATDRAAKIGQGIAFFLGLVGLLYNPMLVFVALFVWMGAREEAQLAHVRSSLQGVNVHQAMITSFRALSPYETISHALEHSLAGFQDDFPVMDAGRLVGVVTRAEILRQVAAGALATPVGSIMCTSFAVAEATEPLAHALPRFGQAECRTMPVLHEGRLVGLLTPERIGEVFVMRERRLGP
jgi:CBS domain-containing protein